MSNGTHPLQDAAQGIINSGLLAQGTLTTKQAYNNAITAGSGIYRDKWLSPRVHIEVDRVSNGYLMAVGSERLIAKDLEELQQHFIAQVVSKLVLDETK